MELFKAYMFSLLVVDFFVVTLNSCLSKGTKKAGLVGS